MAAQTYQLAPEIRLSAFDTNTRAETYLAHLPDGTHLQLSKKLYHLVECLEMPRSLGTLAVEFHRRAGTSIGEEQLVRVISEVLEPRGMLARQEGKSGLGSQTRAAASSSTPPLALAVRRDLVSGRRLAPVTHALRHLFSPPLVSALLPPVAAAHLLTYVMLGIPPRLYVQSVPILLVYLPFFFSVVAHELGHLAACRRSSCRHGPLGIGLYFFGPVFYVDVTEAWRLSRRQRVLVDIGGVYFQLLTTMPLAVIFLLTGQPAYLWVIVMIDVTVLANLSPLIKLDGYWLLSDATGVPNLHKRAGESVARSVRWVGWKLGMARRPRPAPLFAVVGRGARAGVAAYAVTGLAVIPLSLYLILPGVVQGMRSYPALWAHLAVGIGTAVRAMDGHGLLVATGHLIVPVFVVLNVVTLALRSFMRVPAAIRGKQRSGMENTATP